MQHYCKSACLIAFGILLSAGPAFTQTSTDQAAEESNSAAAIVAHVYVQTHQGVDVYDAASSGKLTLVKGSPFATTGQMGGINGKYLISVGTDDLHTYSIESSGVVGKQASEINTQDYSGSECGNTTGNGVLLDRTGKYLIAELYGATFELEGQTYDLCSAFQTYKIASNGNLDFVGDVENSYGYHGNAYPVYINTLSSNDKFMYGYVSGGDGPGWIAAYDLDSSGELTWYPGFDETGPTFDPSNQDGNYLPLWSAADPANHLAVLVYEPFASTTPPPQLASFSINPDNGNIDSTNDWEDMPTPQIQTVSGMNMSPSGKLLALAGEPGLQIFHFNGAVPVTSYSGVLLPTVNIAELAWDNNNHLYALSYSSEKLYVYTVTPTSIKEASGSPYAVRDAYGQNGLIVVP